MFWGGGLTKFLSLIVLLRPRDPVAVIGAPVGISIVAERSPLSSSHWAEERSHNYHLEEQFLDLLKDEQEFFPVLLVVRLLVQLLVIFAEQR